VTECGFPFLGEIAHKVGRTSGWTRGPVVETCADVLSSGDRVLLMCGGGTGAAGEPLFAFSALENIVLELGALTTF
jgi:hypothetical protein